MQKDWRREGLRLGGAVSGRLELELQLPAVSVHLSSVQTFSSQLHSVHAMSSAKLDGSSSTGCAKPVLLESTNVQLSGTSTSPVSVEEHIKVVVR